MSSPSDRPYPSIPSAATRLPQALRDQLARMLGWAEAHAGFDKSVADLPLALQGERPAGMPHSPWELLEHIRLAQRDILDFCREATYQAPEWPQGYWPTSPTPPSADAWAASVEAVRSDRAELQKLASNPSVDLLARVPTGDDKHTILRALLLVADHTSYHLGQLVLVRRQLGSWPG